eukprot:148504-Amphidinium_carterae.1
MLAAGCHCVEVPDMLGYEGFRALNFERRPSCVQACESRSESLMCKELVREDCSSRRCIQEQELLEAAQCCKEKQQHLLYTFDLWWLAEGVLSF